ncbi:CUE domain-containing protein [Aquabacter cavernae]|uniref:CUE domain-containing protein n=1 Tax=Aquabacter cavernae TaxID=2496029 RepID=UPI001FDF643A|nr:CUE domain-containing protein [Aquabacter cavernae]
MPDALTSGAPQPGPSGALDARPFDVSETDIDEALAACDGDARATIRALLIGQAYLEHEMSRRASRAGLGPECARPGV